MDPYLSFLCRALPRDWADYPQALFAEFADHARMLRETVPWCAALEEEAFLQYVLMPRVNDEDLSSHRPLFYGLLWDRVKGLPPEEAVQEVNRWCQEHASYQAQDDRTAAPRTVFRCGSGRCGEESAFLVAALRSVGIAARQVYAPRWSHCDDNHAWVEALCGGAWRFLGACEPEPVLDRGWFNTAAARAVLVHSRTFGPAGDAALHGPALDARGGAVYHNQTARYAPVKRYTFRTAPGARLTLSVLNEARFLPIIEDLDAGEEGILTLELGIGDIHVSAALGDLRAEGICRGAREDGLTLMPGPAPAPAEGWTDFDFRAPAAPKPPAPLTPAQKEERAAVRARGEGLRAARLAGFFDPERAARYPGCADLLREARGNFDEIYAFLSRDGSPLREALLRTLAAKDLRDADAALLEAHLRRAAPYAARFPAQVFGPYLLCPRVAFERLTDWTSPPPGPVGEVIALRAAGIPARLRPLDGAVERWADGAFAPLSPEPMGTVAFTRAPGLSLPYRQAWSLSRRTGAGWRDLLLSDGDWAGDTLTAALPAGRYRAVTSLRLPGGDQFASALEFELPPGAFLELPLRLRACAAGDLITLRELPLVDGRPRRGGRCSLLFWLEEGAEPTEHILNELAQARSALEALPVEITFFLRGEGSAAQPTLAALLEAWPGLETRVCDWAYQVEALSRFLGCDPDRPPLAVVCDGAGRAAYAASGYSVGAVELLRRVAAILCDLR